MLNLRNPSNLISDIFVTNHFFEISLFPLTFLAVDNILHSLLEEKRSQKEREREKSIKLSYPKYPFRISWLNGTGPFIRYSLEIYGFPGRLGRNGANDGHWPAVLQSV